MEKKYWDNFYRKLGAPVRPSNFASFVEDEYGNLVNSIVDVGCGNGRDSFYFASKGINCVGIDQSDSAVEINKNNIPDQNKNLNFVEGDYPSYNYSKLNMDSLSIYSRFTLHSINYDEENVFLDNLSNLDCLNYIFIEVRSINDEIYGNGRKVGEHEFITSHYRRFIDPEILHEKLSKLFEIKSFNESQGYSKTENDDPCLIRVVAKKIKKSSNYTFGK